MQCFLAKRLYLPHQVIQHKLVELPNITKINFNYIGNIF